MNLLLDMNLSPRWVAYLERAGYTAIHWSMLGPPHATDVQIMDFAREKNFIVITHDLDFSAILAATHGLKPSVLQIRSAEVSPESIGEIVVKVLDQFAGELTLGALVTVDPPRARVAILPLQNRTT